MSPDTSRRVTVRRPRIGAGIAAVAALAAVLALGLAGGAASAPPNDAVADAEQIPSLPAKIDGTTKGAKLSKDEPVPSCAAVKGIVWYAVKAPRRGAMVARLAADPDHGAVIVVQRIVRSKRYEAACAATGKQGRADVAWYAYADRSYLIGVARPTAASGGDFQLEVVAAEPEPRPPGEALPAGGVVSTANPILDGSDAWSMDMARGTTYRIYAEARHGCVSLSVYRPRVSSFAIAKPVTGVAPCGGYLAFTPGIDGGGTYSLLVRAVGKKPVTVSYRLEAAPYGADDGAPGVELENGESTTGSVSGRGIDPHDMYRITVPRENELTVIEMQQKPTVGLDLLVLDEAGDQLACACSGRGRQVLRENLDPGTYYVVVRARGKSGGDYRLQVRIRDVTTTSISVGGEQSVEAVPGRSVPLRVDVTSASHGGAVQIEIDRRDPLIGWQFSTVQTGNVSSSGTFILNWTPPSVGSWRARARFLGTPYSSFSSSGYVLVHVAEPLG